MRIKIFVHVKKYILTRIKIPFFTKKTTFFSKLKYLFTQKSIFTRIKIVKIRCDIKQARTKLSQAHNMLTEDPQNRHVMIYVNQCELELNLKLLMTVGEHRLDPKPNGLQRVNEILNISSRLKKFMVNRK